ncbi:RNA methyltransferase [Silvibacterium dinghuense]|uniref:tRNA (cytidine/uridine-2'-O-)-methyltransferase TrmJ n=1 Tax=Silvibacterium dinghuense TaxID=1560006 RepID=A0A4Q1SED8_9BACT|nr:TrmJ/YjtD family RNA methyltransferase [Silvibacterium dinghuense]RXS95465.1 TrmJ/YjtD family RNA methyltransferase [Silvibacterium dinghuense]GGH13373.1 tRNA (cytidine/uridine-2'-O-)-methyltransferase TrmJ [Silvibacterium dinghuense]
MLPEEHSDRLRVVLVATRNPLNIGAAARAMSNFGFRRLRVVQPWEASFREAKSAVGASELLREAELFDSLDDAIADCSLVVGTAGLGPRQVEVPVRRLDDGAGLIREHVQHTPAAILFGSEKRGLSNDDIDRCHWLMHIPTRPAHESMNLGQAVAVTLYELAREATAPPVVPERKPASGEELERLTAMLLDLLATSGYTKPHTEEATAEKTRRMMRRLNPISKDAETLTGMLAKIRYKAERD